LVSYRKKIVSKRMYNFAQFWPQIPIIYDMGGDLGTLSKKTHEN
jgi:hypothetical protein